MKTPRYTPMKRATRKFWLVSVERMTVYRVYAKNHDEACDLIDDSNEVDQETLSMSADVDADQQPAPKGENQATARRKRG